MLYDLTEYDESPCWSQCSYWYPGVSIHAVEQGIIFGMQIVVDLDSGKTVKVVGPFPPP